MMNTTKFGVWDYMVLSLMLIASIIIGIYYAVRGKNQSTTDYMVAGRSMTWLPVALSMIVTYNSSIMMLGLPAEGYVYGISYILGDVGCETGIMIEIILVLAFLKRLDLSSPNEYFERRFKSRGLRLLANLVSCLSTFRYIGIVLYGQSIALQAVTGLSLYVSVGVTAGAAVIYTTIGGLKAVIWTDVLQFIVMLAGLLAVSIKGTLDTGGAREVWNRAAESGRLNFSLDLDPNQRHTVWNLIFGGITNGFGFLIYPSILQRITASKSLYQCRRALFMTAAGNLVLVGIAIVEGIVAYGYYSYKSCDPLASRQIETPNQILPYMTIDLFQKMPGMPGLFLAALSSASLSSISSSLSAVSAIIWYDLIEPCFSNMPDVRALMVGKVTVMVSGVVSYGMAMLFSLVESQTLIQITDMFYSVTGVPLVGLFYLGSLFSFANAKGAVTGLVCSVGFMGWLVIGSMSSASSNNTPYLPAGPTNQCPVVNISSSLSNITVDMSTRLQYNVFTPPLYNFSMTSDHETDSNNSGLEVFYGLSYKLYNCMAICVVVLVGTVVSLATGGLRNRADPELVIQKTDIMCWYRSPDSPFSHQSDVQLQYAYVPRDAVNKFISSCMTDHLRRNQVDLMCMEENQIENSITF